MPEKSDLVVELPRAKTAPQLARHVVRGLCSDRIEGELLADAELLVSELTSNAIIHGRGDIITLRACLDDNRLLVEVIDQGSGFERELRRKEFQQVGGWGLDIVEDLSSRWGVHEGTTHVWFELELPGPRLGEPHRRPDG